MVSRKTKKGRNKKNIKNQTLKKQKGGSYITRNEDGMKKIEVKQTFTNRLNFFKTPGIETTDFNLFQDLHKDTLKYMDEVEPENIVIEEIKPSGCFLFRSKPKTGNYEDDIDLTSLGKVNYLENVCQNIYTVNSFLNEEKNIRNKTYISHMVFHGALFKTEEPFKVVPSNTILCCITPMRYISSSQIDKEFLLNRVINSLSEKQYIELFKYRENVGKTNNEILIRQSIFNSTHFYFDCFRNSSWYYPGQMYPNIELSLDHKDLENNKSPRFEFNFTELSGKKVKNTAINSKKYGTPFYSREELITKTKKDIHRFQISEVVDYYRKDTSKNFKLVIVQSCRPIFEQEYVNFCLKLEFINYEIAKIANNKYFTELELKPTDQKIGLKTKCHFKLYHEHKLGSDDFELVESAFSILDYTKRGNIPNINYDGYIPSLIELYNKIIKLEETITRDDIMYVMTQSPTKIIAFLDKININIPGSEKKIYK